MPNSTVGSSGEMDTRQGPECPRERVPSYGRTRLGSRHWARSAPQEAWAGNPAPVSRVLPRMWPNKQLLPRQQPPPAAAVPRPAPPYPQTSTVVGGQHRDPPPRDPLNHPQPLPPPRRWGPATCQDPTATPVASQRSQFPPWSSLGRARGHPNSPPGKRRQNKAITPQLRQRSIVRQQRARRCWQAAGEMSALTTFPPFPLQPAPASPCRSPGCPWGGGTPSLRHGDPEKSRPPTDTESTRHPTVL